MQKGILIIEDDEFCRVSLCKFFELSRVRLQVDCVESGEEGLELCRKNSYDLAITDLALPGLDGLEIIPKLLELQPDVKIIAVSGSLQDLGDIACSLGADIFFTKPFDVDVLLQKVFELIGPAPEQSGKINESFSLHALLQLAAGEKKSCLLTVRGREFRGRFIFEHGELVHAEANTLVGEEAIRTMLRWPVNQFSFEPYNKPPQRTINSSLTHLLLSASITIDEENSQASARDTSNLPRHVIKS